MTSLEPRFEEILEAADAAVQKGLFHVADKMIAAALAGAPDRISSKILSNISERRRSEIGLRQEKFPPRTREVARTVVWKAVFGVKDEAEPDPEPDKKGKYQKFMEKMAESHPNFIRAREEGRKNVMAEYFRRILEK